MLKTGLGDIDVGRQILVGSLTCHCSAVLMSTLVQFTLLTTERDFSIIQTRHVHYVDQTESTC